MPDVWTGTDVETVITVAIECPVCAGHLCFTEADRLNFTIVDVHDRSVSDFDTPAIGRGNDTQPYQFLDTLSYVRVPGEATAGRCSVVEMQLREGHAPPMHIHESADETIHVLEGAVEVHTSDGATSLEAGGSVVLPRNQAHSLVANEQSTVVASTTPAGFGGFVKAAGSLTDDETIPTSPPSKEAIGKVNALADDHGIEIVGPPPVDP